MITDIGMRLTKYRKVFVSKKLKQLTPASWIWEDFLSKKELEEILNEIVYNEEKDQGFSSILKRYRERLESVFEGGIFEIDGPMERIVRYEGWKNGMAPHIDVLVQQDELIENILLTDEQASKCEYTETKFAGYGMVIYLNDDFEGGELYYPEYDILYKPQAGALVIHDAEAIHGVRATLSGERITHQTTISVIFKVEKNKFEKWKTKYPNHKDLYVDRLNNDALGLKIANKRLLKLKETFINDHGYW
jgi:hypothetical protein